MAHEADIEMGRIGKERKGGPPEETEYKPVNWKKLFFSWKYLPWHILGILILIATALLTIYHDKAVEKLRPFSEKVRDLPAGWLIPLAIMFIISFPPLFGHEIVALLCGVVYGLWIGFGIVAAGTFFGEVGTWFAFKYLFRKKAMKLERTNLNYGALARLTRDGGFWIVLVIRLSAIPSHFSTAVFSTCDVNFWFFCIATLLSLPKQIFLVYLGVLLVQQNDDSVIKTVMFGAVFIVTIALGIWIWWKMTAVKKILLEEQSARREERMKAEVAEQEKEALERQNSNGFSEGEYSNSQQYQPRQQYEPQQYESQQQYEPEQYAPRQQYEPYQPYDARQQYDDQWQQQPQQYPSQSPQRYNSQETYDRRYPPTQPGRAF